MVSAVRGWLQQDGDDLLAVESSGLAEEGLLAVVVLVVAAAELTGFAVDGPAGEGARRGLDVGLAVMALAQGEELEKLAAEILVGLARHAAHAVEIDQHRRIARHVLQERGEVAERLAAEQRVLAEQRRRVTHLLERGGEMVVPEQHHALGERLVGRQHLVDPPVAQLTALFLDRPHDLQLLAVDAGLAFGHRGLLLAAKLGRPLVDPGRRRRERRAPDAAQQSIDRAGVVLGLQRANLGRRGAECGARQQMTGLVEIHRRRGAPGTRQPQAGGKRRRATHEPTPTDPWRHGDAPIAAAVREPALRRRLADAARTAWPGVRPESGACGRAAPA